MRIFSILFLILNFWVLNANAACPAGQVLLRSDNGTSRCGKGYTAPTATRPKATTSNVTSVKKAPAPAPQNDYQDGATDNFDTDYINSSECKKFGSGYNLSTGTCDPSSDSGLSTTSNSSSDDSENNCSNACPDSQCFRASDGSYYCSTQQNTREASSLSTQSPQCAPLMQKVAQCTQKNSSASRTCDSENNSTIANAVQETNTITGQVDGLTGGALTSSCNTLLQAAQGATAALGIFEGQCRSSRNECVDSCKNLVTQLRAARCDLDTIDKVTLMASECEDLKVRESQAQANVGKLQGLAMSVKACQNQFSAMGMPQTCFTNPNGPGCNFANMNDCSNPQVAATSKICICRANPADPSCGFSGKPGTDMAGGGANRLDMSSASGSYSNGQKIDLKNMDFSSESDLAGARGKDKGKGAEEIGGRAGNGANIDSGSKQAASLGQNPNGEAGGINKNILGGFGRGGGGAWGRGGGSGSSGSGGNSGSYGGNGVPNLNNFRPQMGAYQGGRRALAGIVGPDGLLGPHANIWEQIKNRYNYNWQQGQFYGP